MMMRTQKFSCTPSLSHCFCLRAHTPNGRVYTPRKPLKTFNVGRVCTHPYTTYRRAPLKAAPRLYESAARCEHGCGWRGRGRGGGWRSILSARARGDDGFDTGPAAAVRGVG